MSDPTPISVLIVDDSVLMRNLLSRIVEVNPELRLAGTAMNGSLALQKLERLAPDVIVLDLEMPDMNGIEFLRERKRLAIEVPVVILSSIARKGAEITMEALALGASDFIMKPQDSSGHDIDKLADSLVKTIIAYGRRYQRIRGKTPRPAPADRRVEPPLGPERRQEDAGRLPAPARPTAPATPALIREPGPVEIIAIGISTGGPNALREVFAGLDPDLQSAVLVVQHMPAGFTEEFAKSLARVCPLEVKEAAEGDLVKPGRILIAPGNRHLVVEKRPLAAIARILDSDPVNGHRPSADVLFESVAAAYGNRALGVIMTGMGRDGAARLGDIFREGGVTLGQDEASSVVYGMPKVAFENGYVQQQVALADMAEVISRITRESHLLD